jgi:hypothetical protein
MDGYVSIVVDRIVGSKTATEWDLLRLQLRDMAAHASWWHAWGGLWKTVQAIPSECCEPALAVGDALLSLLEFDTEDAEEFAAHAYTHPVARILIQRMSRHALRYHVSIAAQYSTRGNHTQVVDWFHTIRNAEELFSTDAVDLFFRMIVLPLQCVFLGDTCDTSVLDLWQPWCREFSVGHPIGLLAYASETCRNEMLRCYVFQTFRVFFRAVESLSATRRRQRVAVKLDACLLQWGQCAARAFPHSSADIATIPQRGAALLLRDNYRELIACFHTRISTATALVWVHHVFAAPTLPSADHLCTAVAWLWRHVTPTPAHHQWKELLLYLTRASSKRLHPAQRRLAQWCVAHMDTDALYLLTLPEVQHALDWHTFLQLPTVAMDAPSRGERTLRRVHRALCPLLPSALIALVASDVVGLDATMDRRLYGAVNALSARATRTQVSTVARKRTRM